VSKTGREQVAQRRCELFEPGLRGVEGQSPVAIHRPKSLIPGHRQADADEQRRDYECDEQRGHERNPTVRPGRMARSGLVEGRLRHPQRST
jgi:hypothetical protein